jgi:hypothetical protein
MIRKECRNDVVSGFFGINLLNNLIDWDCKNRTTNDLALTVWVTGFYWHKKKRQLLCGVSLSGAGGSFFMDF